MYGLGLEGCGLSLGLKASGLFNIPGVSLSQKEEERQRQVERRKKDRQKLVTKKRNLDTFAKDAKRRTDEFEHRVHFIFFQLANVALAAVSSQ